MNVDLSEFDPGQPFGACVPRRARRFNRLAQHDTSAGPVAAELERGAEFDEKISTFFGVGGKKVDRARKEVCASRLRSVRHALSGCAQEHTRAKRKIARSVGSKTHLGSASNCLLEVKPDELVASASCAFDPVGETLVQVCSSDLCYRQVGSPLNEHVPESEPFPEWTLREVRGEELLPNECVEMPGELRLGCRWDEPGEGIGRERRADHGCTLEDSSFCWAESIQSGRQKSLNRGRKCDAISRRLFARERRELFKEERISASSSCQL